MLSPHAKSEWTTIFVIGVLLSLTACFAGLWWLSIPVIIVTICLILFFRDPDRPIPTQRGIMVAPADGKISSIHEVDFFEPFNGSATCVRIFLSVFDVHINRSPVHGVVTSITHKPGQHLNVLNPESAEVNESNLIVIAHPIRRDAIAAVRQVAGLCARTICCTANTGSVIQRGQRIGIIKLGSTTELYIPQRFAPQLNVEQGQYVYAGSTILANINLEPINEDEPATVENDPVPTEDATQNTEAQTQETALAPVIVSTDNQSTDADPELDITESQEDEPVDQEKQATNAMDAVDDESENEESDAEELNDTVDEQQENTEDGEDSEDEETAENDDVDGADEEEDAQEIESEEEVEYEYVEESDEDEDASEKETESEDDCELDDEVEDSDEQVIEEKSDNESDEETAKDDKQQGDKDSEDKDQAMLF